MFQCRECGRKFKTAATAQRAIEKGCPKCGGTDIDIGKTIICGGSPVGGGAIGEPTPPPKPSPCLVGKDAPKTETKILTPEEVRELLDTNTGESRPLNHDWVEQMAEAIRNWEWVDPKFVGPPSPRRLRDVIGQHTYLELWARGYFGDGPDGADPLAPVEPHKPKDPKGDNDGGE